MADISSVPLLVCAVLRSCYFPLVAWLSLLIGLRFKTQISDHRFDGSARRLVRPLVLIVLPMVIMRGRKNADVR